MNTAVPGNRRAVEDVWVTIILPLLTVSACGGTNSPHPEGTSADNAQWAVVREYLDLQAAWEEQAGGMHDIFMAGGGTIEENLQRAEEEHGQLPDVTAAIAAAQELVAAGGPHTIEAAEFLIERTSSPLAMLGWQRDGKQDELAADVGPAEAFARLRATGDATWEALIDRVGPDWTVVQDHLDGLDAWYERMRATAPPQDGAPPRRPARPSAVRAIATARAILKAEGGHEKTVEAAEFLIDHAGGAPRGNWHSAVGAMALAAYAPGYQNWPRVLRTLDMARGLGGMGPTPRSSIEKFFEEMASDADSPALRATARYFLAAGLMRGANAADLSSEDRAALRERALEQATGLSRGVEEEAFDDPMWLSGHGGPSPRNFAQAEADLIASIQHATVGGTLPEWTGRRLDGTQEPLSAYRGRVLLIDFWATWCGPCITVLPDLRALVADLPADRFALLAISVDEEAETVTEFMKQEAMPWYNWHLGMSSDLERVFDVRGFPTYLLADARRHDPVQGHRCSGRGVPMPDRAGGSAVSNVIAKRSEPGLRERGRALAENIHETALGP